VRRTRLVEPRQLRLWPDWRHFALLTDLDGDPVEVDAFHRRYAIIELAIGDLKRPRAPGLRQVLRQQRLAAVRRVGSRPHPLDGHDRKDRAS
jgi:hypothetical protein